MITAESVDWLNTINEDSQSAKLFKNRNSKRTERRLEPSLGTAVTINQRHNQHEPNDINLRIPKSENTEHMRIYRQTLKYFEIFGRFIGVVYVYDWSPKNHAMFWFTSTVIPFAYCSILYTQFVHYKNGEYLRILELFATYGVAISGGQKLFGYLKHRYDLLSLLFAPDKLCRKNIVGRRADVIKCGLRTMMTLLTIFGIGAIVCIIFFLSVPLKFFVVDNVWMPLYPMKIIFCDESKLSGFLAAIIVQAIIGLLATFGTMLYGASFIVIVSTYTFQVNLIAEDFKDLDEMWSRTNAISVAHKHAYLKNICMKRQDMNNYLDTIKRIYESKLFYYFFFNYFSQIVCLFQITQAHWIPGYSLAVGLFIEMLFYCIMGTLITTANVKLCDIICDTKWYTYDLTSQKIVMLLLHDCQNASDVQLGSIGPLNVVTFIQIVKSIYSYYTVLTELF